MAESVPVFETISLIDLRAAFVAMPANKPLPELRAVRTDDGDAWLLLSHSRKILERRRDKSWRRFRSLDAIEALIATHIAPALARPAENRLPPLGTPVVSLSELAAMYRAWPPTIVAPPVCAVRNALRDEWIAIDPGGCVLEVRRYKTWRRFTTVDAVYSLLASKIPPPPGQQIRLNIDGSPIRLFVDVVPAAAGAADEDTQE